MCSCGIGFQRTYSSTVHKRCACNPACISSHQRNSRRRKVTEGVVAEEGVILFHFLDIELCAVNVLWIARLFFF